MILAHFKWSKVLDFTGLPNHLIPKQTHKLTFAKPTKTIMLLLAPLNTGMTSEVYQPPSPQCQSKCINNKKKSLYKLEVRKSKNNKILKSRYSTLSHPIHNYLFSKLELNELLFKNFIGIQYIYVR